MSDTEKSSFNDNLLVFTKSSGMAPECAEMNKRLAITIVKKCREL